MMMMKMECMRRNSKREQKKTSKAEKSQQQTNTLQRFTNQTFLALKDRGRKRTENPSGTILLLCVLSCVLLRRQMWVSKSCFLQYYYSKMK